MGIYRRKDSPNWWGKYKLKGGSAVYFSTETTDKKLAEFRFTKAKADALQGKHFNRPTKITLGKLAERYLEQCQRQASHENKKLFFRSLFQFPGFNPEKEASEIKREDARAYQNWRCKSVNEQTVNRELSTLRNCYNMAINEMGFKMDNPVAKLKFFSEKKYRRDRFMTTEEKNALFSDSRLEPFWKALYMFAIKTGLRQGEIRELKWTDIDYQNGLVRVVAGEEDSTRFVPMHPIVKDILKQLPKHGRYVFGNEDGTKLSRYGAIVTAFEHACGRQGIADLRFHDLRHTFASDYMMAGGSIKLLSQYMGHTSIRMTERYISLSPEYRQSQITLLPSEPSYAAKLQVIMPENGKKRLRQGYGEEIEAKSEKVKSA